MRLEIGPSGIAFAFGLAFGFGFGLGTAVGKAHLNIEAWTTLVLRGSITRNWSCVRIAELTDLGLTSNSKIH